MKGTFVTNYQRCLAWQYVFKIFIYYFYLIKIRSTAFKNQKKQLGLFLRTAEPVSVGRMFGVAGEDLHLTVRATNLLRAGRGGANNNIFLTLISLSRI
jgi:hypothetical protein